MYHCSTTSAIATKGAADYARALRESGSAKELFVSSYAPGKSVRTFDVQRCFVGVSAEMVFEERDMAANPRRLFDETLCYVNEQLVDFLFFHSPSGRYHLFNLRAVRQVATNHPAYFPAEVIADTRNWLAQNWPMWRDGIDDNCIRYGLLSGFPLEAAIQFARQKSTGQRLPINRVIHSSVTNLSYFSFDAEQDAAYVRQLDEIFIASGIK